MAISQETLTRYGAQAPLRKSAVIIEEARAASKPTAFLCHSHSDASLAKGLQAFLKSQGWEVYIDWDDTTMPATPNRETAEKIQLRIKQLDWFFFLATANSMASRWCPWEIGYADGVKKRDSIVIIPTRDWAGTRHGNEYLQLYRYIEDAREGGFGVFGSDGTGYRLEGMARP